MAALSRRRTRWQAEDGAALIEFAIVLPLMLLVLLGTLDFGMLFQRYQVVTNAAREGARIAVLPSYGDEDVEARVTEFLTAAGLTEPLLSDPTPVRTCEPLPTGGSINVVSVTVEYPYSYSAIGAFASYFDGVGFSRTGLQATAAMRSELAAADSCAGP
jgi:Flp pilus assembly protein TadG